MHKTYADNIEMVDMHFIATGYAKVNDFVNGLHNKKVDAHFTYIKPIDEHHNIARLFWQFGTKENPAMVTGMDILIIEQEKVQKLYVFVDSDH